MCNIGPVGSDNLIREELVPCRVNKRNPKELLDYANQQFTVNKFNAKITKLITKFFFIVGEDQIDNGLRGTTEETAELLTSFENNRKAGTVENAIAMELTKSGNEIFRGYDIGLIQMVLDAYCAMIKMPRGHISQYDDNKHYNWNNLYLFLSVSTFRITFTLFIFVKGANWMAKQLRLQDMARHSSGATMSGMS